MFTQPHTHTHVSLLCLFMHVKFDRKHTMSISIWSLRFAYAYGFWDCYCCCCENESIELKTRVWHIRIVSHSFACLFGSHRKPAKDGQSDGDTEKPLEITLRRTAIFKCSACWIPNTTTATAKLRITLFGIQPCIVRSLVRLFVLFSVFIAFFKHNIFLGSFLFYNKKIYL